MGKAYLAIFFFFALLAFVNYAMFFWLNRKRIWKKEDEVFNEKKKQEAIKELKESQRFLEEMSEPTWDIVGQHETVKVKRVKL